MDQKISLLLPTRGRRALAERFIESVIKTAVNLNAVELIIYVDDDDYDSHQLNSDLMHVKTIIGPKKTMGAYNTECFLNATGDIIVLVNDDMIIRTQAWDEKIRHLDSSIKDKIYLAYGNDLFKKGNLCTFPILSRKTCELLQEPYHRAYRGAFIDYHLMDIFKRLKHSGFDRIFYLEDVVFEHLHYRTGKAEIDETYKARGRFDDDMLFIGLSDVRKISFQYLLCELENIKKCSDKLPTFIEPEKPRNLITATMTFFRVFMTDSQLPLSWRTFMFWWFGARYIAASFFNKN